MPPSACRKHNTYLEVTMLHGLGSDDPDEVPFCRKIIEEITNYKKNRNISANREAYSIKEYPINNYRFNVTKYAF